MKQFCMSFLLCYCMHISANAQINGNVITTYSKFLSMRNARLIECDTIAPYLESVYTNCIKNLVRYRSGVRDRASIRLLKAAFWRAQKCIYKLLDTKTRKRYKRLVKSTGNIFLIGRFETQR